MTMFTAAPTQTRPHRTARTGLGHLLNVWSQRRALRALDAKALSDIGVTRAEASTESRRAFWDAPETWRY